MSGRKRHSFAEITAKLLKAEELAAAGTGQSQIAKVLGISVMTFHRWRKLARRFNPPVPPFVSQSDAPNSESQVTYLAQLEAENVRLRRIVTDLLIETIKMQEGLGYGPGWPKFTNLDYRRRTVVNMMPVGR